MSKPFEFDDDLPPPPSDMLPRGELMQLISRGDAIPASHAKAECALSVLDGLAIEMKLAFYFTYLPHIFSCTFQDYLDGLDVSLVSGYVSNKLESF
jgi:hypothetical protein